VAWVWALAVILVALTLLFGSSFLFGVAMLPLALAVGMVAGQVAGEFAGVKTQAGRPAAEPAPPADVVATEI
jgi:anaerobic C4-dicarboxylate transporter